MSTPADGRADPLRATLVCGGRFHDFDFARLELLGLLAELPDLKTRVAEDYRDTAALAESDLLVTYTCDVHGSEAEQEALASFVERGGRWLALHGTNAVFEPRKGAIATPRSHPRLMQTLGSQFIAHPPITPYTVEVTRPEHPLVAGLGSFRVDDELYLTLGHCRGRFDMRPLVDLYPRVERGAWETPEFHELLRRGLRWAARL